MPIVNIRLFEGRSEEQKLRLADAIAGLMNDIAGSKRDAVHVIFDEVKGVNWYQGGKCLGGGREKTDVPGSGAPA